jgi:hypothetical protein
MKNLKSKAFSLVYFCTILCLSALWTPAKTITSYPFQQHTHLSSDASTYAWSAHASALSYQVTLTPRSSSSPIIFNTTDTWISLAGVPNGTYDVIIRALFTKGNSSIITEDLVQL